MRYLIDGYNLLFRLSPSFNSLSDTRSSILKDLGEKTSHLGLDVLVIFDAHYRAEMESRFFSNSIEVCFTSYGQTADEWILEAVSYNRQAKQITVVTSDKRFAVKVRDLNAKTESVESFISKISKRVEKRKKIKNKQNHLEHSKEVELEKSAETKLDTSVPKPGVTLEGSFDYYLYHFQRSHDKELPL